MSRRHLVPLLGLAAALVGLGRIGGSQLTVPLRTADELLAWVGTTAPVPLAMAVLRLVAQALCGYLLLATLLQVLADALGYPWLTFLAHRALPFALHGGTGLGLAAGSVLSSSATPALAGPRPGLELPAADEPSTARMVLLEPPPSARSGVRAAADHVGGATPPTAAMVLLEPDAVADGPGPGGPKATMVLVEVGSGAPTATMVLLDPPVAVAAGAPADIDGSVQAAVAAGVTGAAAEIEADHEVWVVGAGDSFWAIAEDVVGTGSRTEAYCELLVAANRDRLAVPDQPELLFPGQRLTLPPPAPPGA